MMWKDCMVCLLLWWHLLMICCHYLRQCPVIKFEEYYLIKICCNDGIASLCWGIWQASDIMSGRWWHPADDVVRLSHIKNKARQIELLSVCQALSFGLFTGVSGLLWWSNSAFLVAGRCVVKVWWYTLNMNGILDSHLCYCQRWGQGVLPGIFTFFKIGIFLW